MSDAILSPELNYIKEVLGVSSVIKAPVSTSDTEALVEEFSGVSAVVSPDRITAQVLVWTIGKFDQNHKQLLQKILSSVTLEDYHHIHSEEVGKAMDWSHVMSPWGLCFSEKEVKVDSPLSWVRLPSLEQMLDPSTSMAAKKKTWELLKKYRAQWN